MAPENRPFTDPRTLLGYRKSGQPIYLVAGAEDAPPDGPPADPPKPVEPPADPKPDPAPDATLGDAGKKAIDRERDARKAAEKEKKDLEARLKEYEDRDKSEAQKLADENAALKAENAKAAREALIGRVALEHKLDAADLDLLHGDTEDELSARAKRIAELKTAAGTGSADQGAKPKAPTDLPSQIKAAEQKGDFATAMRLKNQHAASLITQT